MTFLFVALCLAKHDLLPESAREMGEMGEMGVGDQRLGEKQASDAESIRGGVLQEVSGTEEEEEMVDVMTMREGGQCEGVSAVRDGVDDSGMQPAYCEVFAQQRFEREITLATSSSPSSSSSSSSSSSQQQQQAAMEDSPNSTQHMDTAPRFRAEMSALLLEMIHAAQMAAPESNPTEHTETIDPAASAIIPRESRRVERWMSRVNVGDAHDAAEGFNGTQEGDDTDAEDDEESVEMTACRGSRSETASVKLDSDFQNTLRAYMGKGVRDGSRQKGSDCSTPSEGAESGFQEEICKMFVFGNVGGKRRARSL